MLENPFKPNTPIEKTSSKANERLVGSLLGEDVGEEYSVLDRGVAGNMQNLELSEEEKITLVNEKRNFIRSTPEYLKQLILENHSVASLDESFEHGIIRIRLDASELEGGVSLNEHYRNAHAMSSKIWAGWEDRLYAPPAGETLDIAVLSYSDDPETLSSSEKIIADMRKIEMRPLTLEEAIIAAWKFPKLTMTKGKAFVALSPYPYKGNVYVPTLHLQGYMRSIKKNMWENKWQPHNRFLAVYN